MEYTRKVRAGRGGWDNEGEGDGVREVKSRVVESRTTWAAKEVWPITRNVPLKKTGRRKYK